MQATSDLPEAEIFSDLTSEELVRRLRVRQRAAANSFRSLTLRERQILQMVTTGLPNKAVARQLNLSIKTVEKHRGSVMRKLRLKSMCDLLRFWFTLTWDRSLQAD